MRRLKPGDRVIRRRRLLKTRGTVVRFDAKDGNGASRAWIKWSHPTTLPNPSLETVDELELMEEGGREVESDVDGIAVEGPAT
jgi:hypothetical protein